MDLLLQGADQTRGSGKRDSTAEELLFHQFQKYDEDKDGRITRGDLLRMLQVPLALTLT